MFLKSIDKKVFIMKICLITTNEENIFVPKGVNYLIDNFKDIDVICVPGFSSIKRNIYFLFLLYFSELIQVIFVKIKGIFHKTRFKKNFILLNSVNSKQFINLIKKNKYELIISYSCPQIINSENLDQINELQIRLVNFHPGILPKYRGLFTNFYSLKNKEREVGITLHKISKKIDGGEILSILKIPIENHDSIYDLYKKIYHSQDSLNFLVNSIKNLNNITNKIENSNDNSKYNTYPEFIDILKYRIKKF